MRVSCPACDAAYEIPDDLLAAGGRRLRCARCAHEWIPLVTAAPLIAPALLAAPAPNLAPILARRMPSEAMAATDALDQATQSPAGVSPPGINVGDLGAGQASGEKPAGRLSPRLVASPPLTQDRQETEGGPETGSAATAGWVASFAVLAALGVAAYVFRDTVQSAWPPSQLVYAALGLS